MADLDYLPIYWLWRHGTSHVLWEGSVSPDRDYGRSRVRLPSCSECSGVYALSYNTVVNLAGAVCLKLWVGRGPKMGQDTLGGGSRPGNAAPHTQTTQIQLNSESVPQCTIR